MAMQLDKTYDPAAVEPQSAKSWEQAKSFAADPDGPGDSYCIVIPPPNVTAALHMGHALNNTLQDILIRHQRMLGSNVLWMPGTDHAGIATQTVVEKRVLAEEGKKRTDFSRDVFVAKIQAWKDEYEKRITEQLVAMGCSCDWDRQRFTMDDMCAKAVRQAFFRLFADDLIYRGKRLVNWDPATQTALADDEVEMHDVDGHFYYLKYPIQNPDADGPTHVTVATTRPETMLGDTAVAMNPKDPQAAQLRGKFVKLPIVNRIIPIIEDDYVVLPNPDGAPASDEKAKFSSGFLKVTPAHDPNDYDIGKRFDLPVINIMAPDGSISNQHGWEMSDFQQGEAGFLIGLDRDAARKALVDWFGDHDLLEEIKPYRHAVGHSYRSHVPIEPYLSDQWYVKVTDDRLAGAALRAMANDQRNKTNTTDNLSPIIGRTGVSPVSQSGSDSQLTKHRRHLPHWKLDGSTYFITFRIQQGTLNTSERQIILDACLHWHGKRATIQMVTVMPDHVHLLLTPIKKEDGTSWPLSDLMHSIKSFSAHQINKMRDSEGIFWLEESFDRIMRDEAEFLEKCNYMLMNPVKAGLVEQPEAYAFTYIGEECGRGGVGGSAVPADDRRDACPTNVTDAYNIGRTGVSPVSQSGTNTLDACPTDVGDIDSVSQSSWEGQLRFHPARYAKTFQTWHENLRDWCISRQLWWGHQIPVWHLEVDCIPACVQCMDKQNVAVSQGEDCVYVCLRQDDPNIIEQLEKAGFTRDPDVLDTWFSSALWPISTLGWPDDTPELKTWNPGNVLCTAREIITLWVSRMVMFNLYFRDCLPFTEVFIHAMIQDGQGRKMSKSLGNGVDPLDIIHSHGSDAMRYTLASMTTDTQDVRMPVVVDTQTGRNTSDKFDGGRNFANKLWNAVRFALGHLEEAEKNDGPTPPMSLADKWILSRCAGVIAQADKALAGYEFHLYASKLYSFFWNDLCDWYIEAVKPDIRKPAGVRSRQVLATVLDVSLRLLHPMMPFITEKLWQALNEVVPHRGVQGLDPGSSDLLVHARWPQVDRALVDLESEQIFSRLQTIITMIREVRMSNKVPSRDEVLVSIKMDQAMWQVALPHMAFVQGLTRIRLDQAGPSVQKPDHAAVVVRPMCEIYLHHQLNSETEKQRLTKQIAQTQKDIAALTGRLNNKGYTDKAPEHLVAQTRDQLAASEAELVSLGKQLAAL